MLIMNSGQNLLPDSLIVFYIIAIRYVQYLTSVFGCWLLAKTAYMIADFGHGPCGHYADGVA